MVKIVILSIGKALCPNCHKVTDWYVDFYRDDDGIKLPIGVECGECSHPLTDDEFDQIVRKEGDTEDAVD